MVFNKLLDLLTLGKSKAKEDKLTDYGFDFEPEPLSYGKKTIQEMSLLHAQYNEFVVTKTGYIVGAVKVSGINVDLLNEREQDDLFDDYNSFLMTSIGENNEETQQYVDSTVPVNFHNYLLYWKKRYLEVVETQPENKALIQLIASYVHTYNKYDHTNEMTTKLHVVILREKIMKNNFASLEQAAQALDEKIGIYKRNLESALNYYEIQVDRMTAFEYINYLKRFLNHSEAKN